MRARAVKPYARKRRGESDVCVRVLVTSTCTRWAPAGGRRGALRRPPSAHPTVTPTSPSSTASLRLVISRQHLCQPSARDDAQALRGALRARRERVPAEDAAVRAPGARPGAHGAPGAARRLRCGPARHGPDRRLEARPAVDRRHLGEGEDPARGPLRLLRGRGRQRSAPRARGAARARRGAAGTPGGRRARRSGREARRPSRVRGRARALDARASAGFNPADDARSTFKSKAATKKGKNKYLGIFVVLLVGSFIIPMAQYFWYVRDTPDGLFNEPPPPPPPPPAPKKFWER